MSISPFCMNPAGTFTWPFAKGTSKEMLPLASALMLTLSSPRAESLEWTLHPASSGTSTKRAERVIEASCVIHITQQGAQTSRLYQNLLIAMAGVTDAGALWP